MKKSELIKKLEAVPGDPDVAIFDHEKNAHDDIGDGSSVGVYSDIQVEMINIDINPKDWAELHEDDPMPKPWLALCFKNEDYEVRTCRVCGCTDNDCSQCIEKTGRPCHWVEHDLCSACAPKISTR